MSHGPSLPEAPARMTARQVTRQPVHINNSRLIPRLLPELIHLRPWFQMVLDLLVILASAYACAFTLDGLREPQIWPIPSSYWVAVLLTLMMTPWVFHRFGLYRAQRSESIVPELVQLVSAWVTIAMLLSVVAVLTKTNILISRVWLASWGFSALGGMMLSRLLIASAYHRLATSGIDNRNIVVVGSGSLAKHVVAKIHRTPSAGLCVLGYFAAHEGEPAASLPIPYLGELDELATYLNSQAVRPDEIWFALPGRMTHRIEEFSDLITRSTYDFRIVPDTLDYALLNQKVKDIAGLPTVTLNKAPTDGINRFVKAVEDRVLACVILILVAPLMLVIALAVKLGSPGPVIFKQKRHGWNGHVITIYKFRTMQVHEEPGGQVTLATRNDPRVTRVGRFLRRTSLDEFPQFINVLQGRLSIVGPRAQPVSINDKFSTQIAGYVLRHKVKPGITGWAQVNGWRGDMSNLDAVRQRIEHDLFYIKNWSVWFDLAIILLTVVRGFNSPNAH